MEKDFKIANPDDDLSELYLKMQGAPYTFFPVVKNGTLIGVIDLDNINEFMMIHAAGHTY
jgi:predicted transcriptional regulator